MPSILFILSLILVGLLAVRIWIAPPKRVGRSCRSRRPVRVHHARSASIHGPSRRQVRLALHRQRKGEHPLIGPLHLLQGKVKALLAKTTSALKEAETSSEGIRTLHQEALQRMPERVSSMEIGRLNRKVNRLRGETFRLSPAVVEKRAKARNRRFRKAMAGLVAREKAEESLRAFLAVRLGVTLREEAETLAARKDRENLLIWNSSPQGRTETKANSRRNIREWRKENRVRAQIKARTVAFSQPGGTDLPPGVISRGNAVDELLPIALIRRAEEKWSWAAEPKATTLRDLPRKAPRARCQTTLPAGVVCVSSLVFTRPPRTVEIEVRS